MPERSQRGLRQSEARHRAGCWRGSAARIAADQFSIGSAHRNGDPLHLQRSGDESIDQTRGFAHDIILSGSETKQPLWPCSGSRSKRRPSHPASLRSQRLNPKGAATTTAAASFTVSRSSIRPGIPLGGDAHPFDAPRAGPGTFAPAARDLRARVRRDAEHGARATPRPTSPMEFSKSTARDCGFKRMRSRTTTVLLLFPTLCSEDSWPYSGESVCPLLGVLRATASGRSRG